MRAWAAPFRRTHSPQICVWFLPITAPLLSTPRRGVSGSHTRLLLLSPGAFSWWGSRRFKRRLDPARDILPKGGQDCVLASLNQGGPFYHSPWCLTNEVICQWSGPHAWWHEELDLWMYTVQRLYQQICLVGLQYCNSVQSSKSLTGRCIHSAHQPGCCLTGLRGQNRSLQHYENVPGCVLL